MIMKSKSHVIHSAEIVFLISFFYSLYCLPIKIEKNELRFSLYEPNQKLLDLSCFCLFRRCLIVKIRLSNLTLAPTPSKNDLLEKEFSHVEVVWVWWLRLNLCVLHNIDISARSVCRFANLFRLVRTLNQFHPTPALFGKSKSMSSFIIYLWVYFRENKIFRLSNPHSSTLRKKMVLIKTLSCATFGTLNDSLKNY